MGWFEGKSTGSHDLGLPWFTNAASLVVLDFQTYKYHITYYLLKGQYNNIWSRYLMYWKNRTMTNANSTNETRLCSLSSTEMSKWSKQFCLCPVLHPNCRQLPPNKCCKHLQLAPWCTFHCAEFQRWASHACGLSGELGSKCLLLFGKHTKNSGKSRLFMCKSTA